VRRGKSKPFKRKKRRGDIRRRGTGKDTDEKGFQTWGGSEKKKNQGEGTGIIRTIGGASRGTEKMLDSGREISP